MALWHSNEPHSSHPTSDCDKIERVESSLPSPPAVHNSQLF